MPVAPTISQIRAQVSSIKSKVPDADTIGIHSTGQWTGDSEIHYGDSLYLIDQCDSPLELRMALRRKKPSGATRVIITGLDDGDLSDDIRIRLAKRRLFRIDSWQVIRTLFQAHAVDSRVTRHPWMADLLLKYAESGNCPAAPGGFLDIETVWTYLLERGLGFGVARPDLPSLLKWSLNKENVARFRNSKAQFRDAAIEWLAQFSDPATKTVLQCILKSEQDEVLPVGLAAHIVFHERATGKLEKAVGRMEERYLGGESSVRELMCRWGAAAREVVRFQFTDDAEREQLLTRADGILSEVQADSYAHLSDVSLKGFDQRLSQFGETLKEAVESGTTQALREKHEDVLQHYQATREPRRVERVEMAMRLHRWLCTFEKKEQTPCSFSEAVRRYLEDGGFVDTARLALRNGDAVAPLSEAFMDISKRSAEVQEREAKNFADLLKDWLNAGSELVDVISIEDVLTSIVGGISESLPVLLIVMDGMSVAVFNLLIEEIAGRDWAFIRQSNRSTHPAAIATIPSVTEFSRTSLLSGKLMAGSSAIEKREFAKHPVLLNNSKAGKPPLLFHKSALHDSDDGGLSQDIRTKIASKQQHVVGVVINAIDDYLLKGDQIDIRWSPDDIKALPTLLYEAKLANRAVVMVSDHGHILELSTDFHGSDGGDRWREAIDSPDERELFFQGRRVLTDSGKAIVPWSENVRYAMKKNGYHGGINPQEMITPIAVLVPDSSIPEGWLETVWARPEWWSTTPKPQKKIDIEPKTVEAKDEFPESLFDWKEQTTPSESETVAASIADWVIKLMSSSIYAEQKVLAGRSYPKNEQSIVDVLSALHRGGYKMTSGAISNSIDYPPMRLRGLLAVMQKVLNLDGYDVLSRDDDSDTIELNLELLRKQYELD